MAAEFVLQSGVDAFGARVVRVRGAIKVKCHLMFSVVALAVDQILRVTQFRPAPA